VEVRAGAGNALTVDFPPAGSLAVSVKDGEGAPRPDVRVDVLDADGLPVTRRMTDDIISGPGDATRTDDAGRISFPLLAPGTYRVKAESRDGRKAEESVEVRAGDSREIVLTLR
jgi:protocatechuate 3,4-dioxygenase beta subunit